MASVVRTTVVVSREGTTDRLLPRNTRSPLLTLREPVLSPPMLAIAAVVMSRGEDGGRENVRSEPLKRSTL